MSAIVVYRSKTGYTRTYANWIAEELGCQAIENRGPVLEALMSHDVIICGGGIYAGGVQGLDVLTKNFDALRGKRLIAFATGYNPGTGEAYMEGIWHRAIPEEQRDSIKCFYCRGGFDYNQLSLVNKILMSGVRWWVGRSKNPTPENFAMMRMFDGPQDYRDRSYITPIVDYVRSVE